MRDVKRIANRPLGEKLGHRLIKSWSFARSVIASFRGEADYYGLGKESSIALGPRSCTPDLGVDFGINAKTD